MIMDWKPLTMLPCDDRTARERCQGPRRLQKKQPLSPAVPQTVQAGAEEGCAGVCGGVEGEAGVGMRVEVCVATASTVMNMPSLRRWCS